MNPLHETPAYWVEIGVEFLGSFEGLDLYFYRSNSRLLLWGATISSGYCISKLLSGREGLEFIKIQHSDRNASAIHETLVAYAKLLS